MPNHVFTIDSGGTHLRRCLVENPSRLVKMFLRFRPGNIRNE
jgi:hexokinase